MHKIIYLEIDRMKNNRIHYIKNTFLPLVVFSLVTGVATGVVIFLFKLASSEVISLSHKIYEYVGMNPAFIPLLLLGAAFLGLLAANILHVAPEARGGGIPSAITVLQGYVPVEKIIGMPMVFLSSLISYLGGVPLGTEGPSVQMGTLIGGVVSRTLGKKAPAWRRYIMTGGACAGFAAATGGPLTGILFAFEEAHRRFTPMIFMSASMTVAVCAATMEVLCGFAGISPKLFHFEIKAVMELKYVWISLLIGLVCGLFAIVFTKVYGKLRKLLNKRFDRVWFAWRIVIIFVAVALVGVISYDMIGSGHHNIDLLLEGEGVFYLLILFLLVRIILIMVSNIEGVTGGLFIPCLAIGATLGFLCGKAMIALGVLPEEYLVIAVVIGMCSYLAASSRIPLTAMVFSVEVLSGIHNLLPIAIGVAVSYAVIEVVGIHDFIDAVIEKKIDAFNKGREMIEMDVELIVKENSFVVGREVRDILWPPSCVIVSILHDPVVQGNTGISVGDLIRVHYRTTHPHYIARKLEDLVGEQTETES